MYRLENKDTVAQLRIVINPDTRKQNLELIFNGRTVAVFDEGEQLRHLDEEYMGDWRECDV